MPNESKYQVGDRIVLLTPEEYASLPPGGMFHLDYVPGMYIPEVCTIRNVSSTSFCVEEKLFFYDLRMIKGLEESVNGLDTPIPV